MHKCTILQPKDTCSTYRNKLDELLNSYEEKTSLYIYFQMLNENDTLNKVIDKND